MYSSSTVSNRPLEACLGAWLPREVIQKLARSLVLLQPAVGEVLWHSEPHHSSHKLNQQQGEMAERQSGLWLVLGGRVRLIDNRGELFLTLGPGSSFAEDSFLADLSSQAAYSSPRHYSARASSQAQLAYLPAAKLPTAGT